MKNRVLEILESDFANSKYAMEKLKGTVHIGGGDIFNRYDYENILNASKNMIDINDNELWCLITGLKLCDGEDFNPLREKLESIRDQREVENENNQ